MEQMESRMLESLKMSMDIQKKAFDHLDSLKRKSQEMFYSPLKARNNYLFGSDQKTNEEIPETLSEQLVSERGEDQS